MKDTTAEFPEGKENYCPRCYFEDEKTILRKDCPHNVKDTTAAILAEFREKFGGYEIPCGYDNIPITGCIDEISEWLSRTITHLTEGHARELAEAERRWYHKGYEDGIAKNAK